MGNQSLHKNILIISLVVVAAAIFIMILASGSLKNSPAPTGQNVAGEMGLDPAVVSQNRSEIMTWVRSGKTLTDDQRSQIIEWLSGDKINAYLFSNEEKNMLIEALNKH